METTQDKIKTLLGKAGIPAKEIQVLGSSIIITCYSQTAAEKFGRVLAAAKIRVRGVVESREAGQKVWRVGGAI